MWTRTTRTNGYNQFFNFNFGLGFYGTTTHFHIFSSQTFKKMVWAKKTTKVVKQDPKRPFESRKKTRKLLLIHGFWKSQQRFSRGLFCILARLAALEDAKQLQIWRRPKRTYVLLSEPETQRLTEMYGQTLCLQILIKYAELKL